MTTSEHNKKERRRCYISPADFFSTDVEKIKLNWFLFEFAVELEMFIAHDRQLRSRLLRKGVTDAQIGRFCVHYAKNMRGQILDRIAGKIPHVRISYEKIEAFFPLIGDLLVDRILNVAAKAWDSQTEGCEVCPTRCISEKDERALMFDDPYYWE